MGPVCSVVGTLLLLLQLVMWLQRGVLFSGLIGCGSGLLLIGIIAWFYRFDDRRAGMPMSRNDEAPSADEYEQWFNAANSTDDSKQP